MNNIMKLADAYADRFCIGRKHHNKESTYDRAASRAALEAAVEKQAAEIDQLNARWTEWKDSLKSVKEQRNAMQAEVERLTDINRDALSNLNALCDSKNTKIADLQAKLSAMEKQEPVGFISPHNLQMLSEGYPQTVVMLAGAKHTEALYTAPKVAQPPEYVNCDTCVYHYKGADQKPCNTCIHSGDFVNNFEPRFIGGQQP